LIRRFVYCAASANAIPSIELCVLTLLNVQLSKYPALNNLEKQIGVPKAYAVIGVAALYFFLIIFNIGGQLLTNFAGFVLPGYYSLGALFSQSKEDDTQWLTVSYF
jgi:receptor expression-enhancing protein 5/6